MNSLAREAARTPTIVVAVDDAEPVATSADLTFAAAEARARGAKLRLVHACATLSPAGILGDYVTQERLNYGQHVLDAASAVVRGSGAGAVRTATVNSRELAADVLVAESRTAALLVLLAPRATPRRPGAGSTVRAVVGRALCPVVVLPLGSTPPDASAGVVVAVDEQGDSGALVRLAAAEAVRRSVALTAVHVWQPFGAHATSLLPPTSDPTERAVEEALAARRLADALTEVAEEFAGLELGSRVVEGVPGDVLVELSRRAALLVVGRHGTPQPDGQGLGRVVTELVARAQCPLMVSPTAPRGPRVVLGDAVLAGGTRG